MGYSVRSSNFRYTEWRVWNQSALEGVWSEGGLVGSELYDHRNESVFPIEFDGPYETVNVVNDTSMLNVVKYFKKCLIDRFVRVKPCLDDEPVVVSL